MHNTGDDPYGKMGKIVLYGSVAKIDQAVANSTDLGALITNMKEIFGGRSFLAKLWPFEN
jgi:hypothetical protein